MAFYSSLNLPVPGPRSKAHQLGEDRAFAVAYLWARGRAYELGHLTRTELTASVQVFLHLGGDSDQLGAVLVRQDLAWDGKEVRRVDTISRRPAIDGIRRGRTSRSGLPAVRTV